MSLVKFAILILFNRNQNILHAKWASIFQIQTTSMLLLYFELQFLTQLFLELSHMISNENPLNC